MTEEVRARQLRKSRPECQVQHELSIKKYTISTFGLTTVSSHFNLII